MNRPVRHLKKKKIERIYTYMIISTYVVGWRPEGVGVPVGVGVGTGRAVGMLLE